MDELNIMITAMGGIVLFLGLLSDYFRRHWWASDPLFALGLGVLLSPIALDWIDPDSWGISRASLLEQSARLTLAIGLMGVALRLPRGYFMRNWQAAVVLLGAVMPLMWLVSGVLVSWILNLPFWEAMVIAAAITPTDPIVSSSIVTGAVADENLPGRLQDLISAESGANDGLAYPLMLLSIAMFAPSQAQPLPQLIAVVLWEVGGAVGVGALVGYIAGRLLEWAEQKQTIERQSFLGYTIALSLVVLGMAKLVGTDGILAVFVAGLAFDHAVSAQERAEEDNVQEAINRFFTLPIFILLGLTIPWQAWGNLGWRAILLVVAVLLFRRLPVLLLLRHGIPPLQNRTEAMFMGWFGPIGVAAMFYAGYALRETNVEVWTVCSLMICASIVAQGLSSSPFTRRYGQYARSRHQQT